MAEEEARSTVGVDADGSGGTSQVLNAGGGVQDEAPGGVGGAASGPPGGLSGSVDTAVSSSYAHGGYSHLIAPQSNLESIDGYFTFTQPVSVDTPWYAYMVTLNAAWVQSAEQIGRAFNELAAALKPWTCQCGDPCNVYWEHTSEMCTFK